MSAALKTPHANAAAEALRAEVLKPYEGLKDTVGSVARAVIRLRSVEDVVEVLVAVNALSLAAEALATACTDMTAAADRALVETMTDTGCTGFATTGHNVSLRQNPPSVDITEPKAVPAEYMSAPKPSPDKAKIRAALQADPTKINWAVLRSGTISLQRRSL